MKWEIIKHQRLFKRYFSLEEYRMRYERFDGGNNEVVREIFERGDAAAVLPYDARRDEVILIEQFRAGAVRFSKHPWLMEVVAGIINEGEEAEAVARREALEETGCQLGEILPVHRYLVSPGGTTESCALFVGDVDATSAGGVHGLDEEHEDIKVHVVSRQQAMQLLETDQVCNAVTIIALQWLAQNHEKLQSRWG